MKNYRWIFLLLIGIYGCSQNTSESSSNTTDFSNAGSNDTDTSNTGSSNTDATNTDSNNTETASNDTTSTEADTSSTSTEIISTATDTDISSTGTDISSTEVDTSSTSTETISSATDTDTSSTAVDTSSTGTGLLFGFWGLNGYSNSVAELQDVNARFNATVFQVASSAPHYTVTTLLPLVRASGMKVTLRMTGDHGDYTTGGNFDLAKWEAEVALWQASGVQEFIDDGTLVGHMLLDDIFTFSGTDPTASDLDEMARYSKEILPGLMTFVRNKATTMPVPTTGEYVYLDACVNQYTNYPGFSDGDINTYATTQATTALGLNLGIINGLNIADGGDGSSGHLGASAAGSSGVPKYAMSATEISTYGTALLSHDLVLQPILFLMWEYDGEQVWQDGSIGADYFDQTDFQNALYQLGSLAASY